jgi:formylmethanofuran dehydrogenase subunit E
MCSIYVPDNYDAFCRHDAEEGEIHKRLPRCAECGEPIQEDTCYEIGSSLYCVSCVSDSKVYTEDYAR